MSNTRKRTGFWRSIFQRQPIEPGVHDPVEVDLETVRRGFHQANDDMRAAMEAFLSELEARQKKGNTHAPRSH